MEDIKAIFDRQEARRWTTSRSSAEERIAKLARFREAVLARADEFCEAIGRDFGKPPAESLITEIYPVVAEINHAMRHLRRWMRPVRVGTPLLLFGTRAEYRHEAKGVVLILSPWNYPVNLLLCPLVAAIAAGNCAMLKPSSKVPATSRFLKDFIAELFDEDEVALVEGSSEVSDALLELPFDHVFFTGSPPVGRKVMAAAARQLAPVTLELGGKSPVIVDSSADIVRAAERIVWAKFVNAGQTCIAPDYVLVHKSREREFLRVCTAVIARRFGNRKRAGDERPEVSENLCRLVSSEHLDKLKKILAAAVARGAIVETGGETAAEDRYMEPTMLSGIDGDSPIMTDEIFGPILPVIAFDTIDDATALIRSRPKPLALYVFGRNKAAIEAILSSTTSGGTCVNSLILHFANGNLPFGGVGMSGMGNYHGHFGFKTFSHERAVLRQGPLDLVRFFYPPYGKRTKKLIEFAMRHLV